MARRENTGGTKEKLILAFWLLADLWRRLRCKSLALLWSSCY